MIYETSCSIELARQSKIYHAYFVMGQNLGGESNLVQTLSIDELKEYNTHKYKKRMVEYSFGRYIAKKSVIHFLKNKNLNEITIGRGVFNQPVVYSSEDSKRLQVSISHVNNIAVSIVFPEEHPMGIDIEKISDDKLEALSKQLSDNEKTLLYLTNLEKSEGFTLLWTVKEAISKVMKTGLTVPLSIFSVKSIEKVNGGYISEFDQFLQYKVFSWIIDTYICSICMPRYSSFTININKVNLMPIDNCDK
ncbi:4'-phosphopantetheinyl transferase family protein [Oceanobacillus manasiensis]|uniref:4'-phosphopantetheinyl transferase family protein n=1 Tax=Oceanobacillus manasiensis TaxID=586413 RepID=UPI00069380CC|nr:4'-phosphopantetheinyl transferase superfamily protein [Oceanobacillus manasiensis]